MDIYEIPNILKSTYVDTLLILVYIVRKKDKIELVEYDIRSVNNEKSNI